MSPRGIDTIAVVVVVALMNVLGNHAVERFGRVAKVFLWREFKGLRR